MVKDGLNEVREGGRKKQKRGKGGGGTREGYSSQRGWSVVMPSLQQVGPLSHDARHVSRRCRRIRCRPGVRLAASEQEARGEQGWRRGGERRREWKGAKPIKARWKEEAQEEDERGVEIDETTRDGWAMDRLCFILQPRWPRQVSAAHRSLIASPVSSGPDGAQQRREKLLRAPFFRPVLPSPSRAPVLPLRHSGPSPWLLPPPLFLPLTDSIGDPGIWGQGPSLGLGLESTRLGGGHAREKKQVN